MARIFLLNNPIKAVKFKGFYLINLMIGLKDSESELKEAALKMLRDYEEAKAVKDLEFVSE